VQGEDVNRTRAGEGFEVEPTASGGVDLKLDGRVLSYDLVDLDEAMTMIVRRDPKGTHPVTFINTDGYREDLTRR
jgi:hypothetical protein